MVILLTYTRTEPRLLSGELENRGEVFSGEWLFGGLAMIYSA